MFFRKSLTFNKVKNDLINYKDEKTLKPKFNWDNYNQLFGRLPLLVKTGTLGVTALSAK